MKITTHLLTKHLS